MSNFAVYLTDFAGRRGPWAILIPVVLFFALAYLALIGIYLATGVHLHAFNTLLMLVAVLIATVVPAAIAYAIFNSHPLSNRQRRQETLAWSLIASAALANLIARGRYIWDEHFSPDTAQRIPIADVLLGLVLVGFIAGLLLIPWTHGPRRGNSTLLDLALVLVGTGTLLWPLLVGPAWHGELAPEVAQTVVRGYVVGVAALVFVLFWIVLRDLRRELWPVALAFVAAILTIVVTQVFLYAFMAEYGPFSFESVQILTTRALMILTSLLVVAAALFRVSSVQESVDSGVSPKLSDQSLIHFWQIVLPYPIIALVIILRLGMHWFDWRLDYATEMIPGIAIVAVLMIFRQLQMLRHNHELYQRVSSASHRDGLTHLYNHRSLQDILRGEVERAGRLDGSFAIIFMDIDRFKSFNDSYGHQKGDEVLVSVADILTSNCRTADLVGRYGGEEFMVVAPDVDRKRAAALGERLRRAVAGQEIIFTGERASVTVSVGIALYPDDAEDPQTLIGLADQRLYHAKSEGGNITVTDDPGCQQPA